MKAKENVAGYLFVLPSLLGFILLVLFPVLFSFVLSFSEWSFVSGFQTIRFIGLDNFIKLFSDVWFLDSLRNNVIFTLVTIPLTICISLCLAVILNGSMYLKALFKILFFTPYISSIVAISIVWMVLLHPSYGPINEILRAIGIDEPPRWLASTQWALPAVMVISIWQGLGYYIIVYIAGLQGIPKDLYEASEIDGATAFRKFWHITIPMISSTTFFLVVMGIIASFKVFDQISILTSGGPGTSTTVLAFYIYRAAFENYKMGYASSIAWILFIAIFAVTFIQWKMQKKWVTYD